MFITAIGRIGSIIRIPSRSLDFHVFLDAGGRASERRVWGGLACVGDRELAWLEQKIGDLKKTHTESTEESGELKGKHVSTPVAKKLGRYLREEDRQSIFWATWCPELNQQDLAWLRTLFSSFLASQKADPYRLDCERIDDLFRGVESCFVQLKAVNQHKLISVLQHLKWLGDRVKEKGLGPQLRSVRIVVDRENLPDVGRCAALVKEAVAAMFQAAGMSYTSTGRWFKEKPDEGAIVIDLSGDSTSCVGLQYVDILLQAVQRQLPGFGRGRNGHTRGPN
jgi:hypothetical protein